MASEKYVSMSTEAQDCKACGASISFGDSLVAKCEYCDTENRLLQPIKFQKSSDLSIKGEKLTSFNNMLKICETSMTAGSYKEAYDYCNRLLEIDPENGEIYANKAICALYESTSGNIYDGAKDISTFIKTALKYDPHSKVVMETAENIAYNLYYFSFYKISIYAGEKLSGIYLAPALKGLLPYIKVWDTAFEIHNDTEFLKNAVTILSGQDIKDPFELEGLAWGKMDEQIKSSKVREMYIKKIKNIEPDYNPPSIKKGGCFIATATIGNYNHPTVMSLRGFRDNYLLHQNWGRAFIQFYYKWGPYPANIIEKSDMLKKLSYFLIVRPLAFIASKLNNRK